MIDDLKPCPLCGGKPCTYVQLSKSGDGMSLMVGCAACNAYIYEHINSTGFLNMKDFERMYFAAQNRLERWNDRA